MSLFKQKNTGSQRLRTDRSIADQLGLSPNDLVSPAEAARIEVMKEQHERYVKATEGAFSDLESMERGNTRAHGAKTKYAGTYVDEQSKRLDLSAVHQIRQIAAGTHQQREKQTVSETGGILQRYFG